MEKLGNKNDRIAKINEQKQTSIGHIPGFAKKMALAGLTALVLMSNTVMPANSMASDINGFDGISNSPTATSVEFTNQNGEHLTDQMVQDNIVDLQKAAKSVGGVVLLEDGNYTIEAPLDSSENIGDLTPGSIVVVSETGALTETQKLQTAESFNLSELQTAAATVNGVVLDGVDGSFSILASLDSQEDIGFEPGAVVKITDGGEMVVVDTLDNASKADSVNLDGLKNAAASINAVVMLHLDGSYSIEGSLDRNEDIGFKPGTVVEVTRDGRMVEVAQSISNSAKTSKSNFNI